MGSILVFILFCCYYVICILKRRGLNSNCVTIVTWLAERDDNQNIIICILYMFFSALWDKMVMECPHKIMVKFMSKKGLCQLKTDTCHLCLQRLKHGHCNCWPSTPLKGVQGENLEWGTLCSGKNWQTRPSDITFTFIFSVLKPPKCIPHSFLLGKDLLISRKTRISNRKTQKVPTSKSANLLASGPIYLIPLLFLWVTVPAPS